MLRHILFISSCLGAAAAAFAQVAAPQLGWVPDGAEIRPVYGIPAAAAVGSAVTTGQNFARMAIAPAGDFVLASAGRSGSRAGAVLIYTQDKGIVPVSGAGSAPDLMVLSPRGSSAALWFASGGGGSGQAQVITGLPNNPAVRQVNASFPDSDPTSLAISDDGARLSGVWASGVYVFGPEGQVDRLPLGNAGVSTAAFLNASHNLAAAGPGGVQMVTDAGGSSAVSMLLSSADVSFQPVGIAATADNRTLVIAGQSGSVTTIDITSGAITSTNCGCKPAGLFAMGSSAFRLTGLQEGAFKLFDATRGETLFAPLALADTTGAGQ